MPANDNSCWDSDDALKPRQQLFRNLICAQKNAHDVTAHIVNLDSDHGQLYFCLIILILSLLYTLNHKKRDILFLTITLANLNRFFIVFISF